MRHKKDTFKVGRTGSHRRAMIANMLKSLIEHGRIKTTKRKAEELKRYADRSITLAKNDSKRLLKSLLMLRYNRLSSKEKRRAKAGDISSYNTDRRVFKILEELKVRFLNRNGGYTRIIKSGCRVGDGAESVYIEFVE